MYHDVYRSSQLPISFNIDSDRACYLRSVIEPNVRTTIHEAKKTLTGSRVAQPNVQIGKSPPTVGKKAVQCYHQSPPKPVKSEHYHGHLHTRILKEKLCPLLCTRLLTMLKQKMRKTIVTLPCIPAGATNDNAASCECKSEMPFENLTFQNSKCTFLN